VRECGHPGTAEEISMKAEKRLRQAAATLRVTARYTKQAQALVALALKELAQEKADGKAERATHDANRRSREATVSISGIGGGTGELHAAGPDAGR
jgi:hypothetical protein